MDFSVAMVPLGTGNDLSQALGWGSANPTESALLSDDYAGLKAMATAWYHARSEMHDVWRMTIKCDPNTGAIFQKERALVGDDGHDRTSLDVDLLLYCGIAKEAEVAYNVELNRTSSQCGNKCMYALQGFRLALDFFCCQGQRVANVITGMYSGVSSKDPAIFECGFLHRQADAPRLNSNPEMILCLNINSFCGGEAKDLWRNSWRLGVDQPLSDDLLDVDQVPGDKQLQVLTLQRLARLVMPTQRILAGRRVFSGAPIHFEFKQRRRVMVTYIQVDGESYKLMNPMCATIRHKQQIRVLHNDSADASCFNVCLAHHLRCCPESVGSHSEDSSDSELN
eukprot:TRINITY_DN5565_c1_g2_i1.p1 TRINITY_DN5565_c1_g2~~TRINITY_DN5565_c1_g2_i1.p1  ORF type:complete len:338 (-),score=26.55 TRINITY_DN5565_c1_g2_i1:60-1073(-)